MNGGKSNKKKVFLEESRAKEGELIDAPEEDINGRYKKFNKLLGKGACKSVYAANDTETGCDVAWNEVDLSNSDAEQRKSLMGEVETLSKLQHKYILKFHSRWHQDSQIDPTAESLVFITDIMQGGSLKTYIKQRSELTRLSTVKSWISQILEGLDYLHSRSPPVAHRDLKCDNIFINNTDSTIVIGDLGFTAPVHQTMAAPAAPTEQQWPERHQSIVGTPEFMAPEIYDEKTAYDVRVDIYALGMCILELITTKYPYEECGSFQQLYTKVVVKAEPPDALAHIGEPSKHPAKPRERELRERGGLACKEFIKLCISKVSVRPYASELRDHPFLNRANKAGYDDLFAYQFYTDPEEEARPLPIIEEESAAPDTAPSPGVDGARPNNDSSVPGPSVQTSAMQPFATIIEEQKDQEARQAYWDDQLAKAPDDEMDGIIEQMEQEMEAVEARSVQRLSMLNQDLEAATAEQKQRRADKLRKIKDKRQRLKKTADKEKELIRAIEKKRGKGSSRPASSSSTAQSISTANATPTVLSPATSSANPQPLPTAQSKPVPPGVSPTREPTPSNMLSPKQDNKSKLPASDKPPPAADPAIVDNPTMTVDPTLSGPGYSDARPTNPDFAKNALYNASPPTTTDTAPSHPPTEPAVPGPEDPSRVAQQEAPPAKDGSPDPVSMLDLPGLQCNWVDREGQGDGPLKLEVVVRMIDQTATSSGKRQPKYVVFKYSETDHAKRETFIEDAITDLQISRGQAGQLIDKIALHWDRGPDYTHGGPSPDGAQGSPRKLSEPTKNNDEPPGLPVAGQPQARKSPSREEGQGGPGSLPGQPIPQGTGQPPSATRFDQVTIQQQHPTDTQSHNPNHNEPSVLVHEPHSEPVIDPGDIDDDVNRSGPASNSQPNQGQGQGETAATSHTHQNGGHAPPPALDVNSKTRTDQDPAQQSSTTSTPTPSNKNDNKNQNHDQSIPTQTLPKPQPEEPSSKEIMRVYQVTGGRPLYVWNEVSAERDKEHRSDFFLQPRTEFCVVGEPEQAGGAEWFKLEGTSWLKSKEKDGRTSVVTAAAPPGKKPLNGYVASTSKDDKMTMEKVKPNREKKLLKSRRAKAEVAKPGLPNDVMTATVSRDISAATSPNKPQPTAADPKPDIPVAKEVPAPQPQDQVIISRPSSRQDPTQPLDPSTPAQLPVASGDAQQQPGYSRIVSSAQTEYAQTPPKSTGATDSQVAVDAQQVKQMTIEAKQIGSAHVSKHSATISATSSGRSTPNKNENPINGMINGVTGGAFGLNMESSTDMTSSTGGALSRPLSVGARSLSPATPEQNRALSPALDDQKDMLADEERKLKIATIEAAIQHLQREKTQLQMSDSPEVSKKGMPNFTGSDASGLAMPNVPTTTPAMHLSVENSQLVSRRSLGSDTAAPIAAQRSNSQPRLDSFRTANMFEPIDRGGAQTAPLPQSQGTPSMMSPQTGQGQHATQQGFDTAAPSTQLLPTHNAVHNQQMGYPPGGYHPPTATAPPDGFGGIDPLNQTLAPNTANIRPNISHNNAPMQMIAPNSMIGSPLPGQNPQYGRMVTRSESPQNQNQLAANQRAPNQMAPSQQMQSQQMQSQQMPAVDMAQNMANGNMNTGNANLSSPIGSTVRATSPPGFSRPPSVQANPGLAAPQPNLKQMRLQQQNLSADANLPSTWATPQPQIPQHQQPLPQDPQLGPTNNS